MNYPGPTGEGTIDIHVSEFMGRKDEAEHKITAYVLNEIVEDSTVSGPFPSSGKFTFVDVEAGTQVTVISEAEPSGIYRFLAPIIVWIAKRQLKRDSNLLREALEGE